MADGVEKIGDFVDFGFHNSSLQFKIYINIVMQLDWKGSIYMFTRVDEIWYEPFRGKDEVPELVIRVLKSLQEIRRLYADGLTDIELLERGIDPDMVNEFCMFHQDEWPELEKYYQDENGMYNMDDAGMVSTKQYRAQLICSGIDPETEQPIGQEEGVMPTYEEWKAGLTEAQREFPHTTLFGSGEPADYVQRLMRERDEFEEMAQSIEQGDWL